MVKVRVCPFSKSFSAEQRRRTLVNYLISDILLQLFTKLTVFGLTSQSGNELVHCLFGFLLHLTEDVSLVRSVELWREVSILTSLPHPMSSWQHRKRLPRHLHCHQVDRGRTKSRTNLVLPCQQCAATKLFSARPK